MLLDRRPANSSDAKFNPGLRDQSGGSRPHSRDRIIPSIHVNTAEDAEFAAKEISAARIPILELATMWGGASSRIVKHARPQMPHRKEKAKTHAASAAIPD